MNRRSLFSLAALILFLLPFAAANADDEDTAWPKKKSSWLLLSAPQRDQVKDFADKILWLMAHPEERARMGESGRRRVQTQLAWEYSVPHLVAAYERAFAKRAS